MLKVPYPIIVEGKYDKSTLSSLIEGDIIVTGGFGIYKDKEKLAMIRRLALQDKIIILTDSDRAGFQIRRYIAGSVPQNHIVHIYIPQILGKEHRKTAPSAEGTLGVEGMPIEILRKAFVNAGVLEDEPKVPPPQPVTKAELYALGLYGQPQSARLRRELLISLGLPAGIGPNALPGILTRTATLPELTKLIQALKEQLL